MSSRGRTADRNEVRPRLVLRGLEEEIHAIFADASTWQRRLRDANFGGPESREGARIVRDLIESALLVGDPGAGWSCWSRSSRTTFDPLRTLAADAEAALSNPAFADSLRLYQALRERPRAAFPAWRYELLQNPGTGDLAAEAFRIARLLAILEAALRPSEPLDAALGIDFRTIDDLKSDPAFARLGYLQRQLRDQKRHWDDTKRDLREALARQRVRWPARLSTEIRYPFYAALASFRGVTDAPDANLQPPVDRG